MGSEPEFVEATLVRRGLNRKYLRVEDLRRLKHVFFSGRRPIEGMYSGRHDTRQRGQSVEFRDYRPYMTGDDIGSVDWKVYGRSDKLFIKMFEHQADMTVHLLVDGSASMAYSGLRGKHSKYDHACFLAASIGFLVVKQHDRVGFALAHKGLRGLQRPQSSLVHLSNILAAMEQNSPCDTASLAAAINTLTGVARRRDLLILFSDLLDDSESVVKALAAYVERGGEAIVFHVLHDDELHLPQIESGTFIDSETSARVRLQVNDVRAQYETKMQEFLAFWSKAAKGHGVDYQLVSTAQPYHRALERYLFGRAARR